MNFANVAVGKFIGTCVVDKEGISGQQGLLQICL
jgi:hypothetical protein